MKLIDKIKEELVGNIFTNEEIDNIMEREKYYPVEQDEDDEEGILKYTNKRSQLWIKYVREEDDYLVSDITMRTKKNGKTTVHAFRNPDDIKKMMDYFRDNKKYDEFLIFMLGMLLARRIGDTLSLKWSDFYYENGNKKKILNTLIEQKTDKVVDISVSEITWKYIDWYCNTVAINPMDHFMEDIFMTDAKRDLDSNCTDKEYQEVISKQSASFRYEFKKAADCNGIENVSTHSMRKSFGYISHQINKFDPDNLQVLQTVLGHSDVETTKRYIDIMNEKAEKMFGDVGQYILDIDNGITPTINNSPIVALKAEDFRELLSKCYDMASKGIDKFEAINGLISKAEQMMV